MLHKRLKGYTILMNLFLARLKNINHKDQAGSECCNKSLGSKGYFQGNKKQAWHNHDLSIYQVAKNNDHSPIIWSLSERLKYSATTPTNSGTTDLYIPQLTSWNTVFQARNFLCIRYLSAIYSIHVSYQNHPLKSLTCFAALSSGIQVSTRMINLKPPSFPFSFIYASFLSLKFLKI